MRWICYLIVVAFFFSTYSASSQSSMVHNRLRAVTSGKAEDVKKELPELMKEYPDDPGVMFLNGVLIDDGAKAVVIYEQITREHPQSEWADDAQWRIVQFYCLKRDTARAHRELTNFKRNYPLSEFLIHAMDIVKYTVGSTAPASTTKAVSEKPVTPAPKTQKESLLVESKPAAKKEAKPEATTEAKPDTHDAAKHGEKADKDDVKTTDKSASADSKSKHWGLQVGLYASKSTAEQEAKAYREQRMKVEVVSKDGKYAVVVGNYSSRESAENSKEIIKAQCQCTPYIIEK